MGWEPFKVPFSVLIGALRIVKTTFDISQIVQVTYTSDYFQDLYDLAVELIRRNHAYVDHQVDFLL